MLDDDDEHTDPELIAICASIRKFGYEPLFIRTRTGFQAAAGSLGKLVVAGAIMKPLLADNGLTAEGETKKEAATKLLSLLERLATNRP